MISSSDLLHKTRKMILLCPVWGREYCETLVSIIQISMLRPGNIPALRFTGSQLLIATSSKDKAWLQAQDSVIKLRAYISVSIVECDDLIDARRSKYEIMNDMYFFLHSRAGGDPSIPTPYVYWQPDVYLPEGSIEWLGEQIYRYKAVMVPGIRVNKSEFLQDAKLLNDHSRTSEDNFAMLHRIVVNNLHSISLSLEIDSFHFNNSWPSHLYVVDRNASAIVAKGFHYHPILLMHSQRQFLENSFGTIDDRLIDVLGLAREEILLVTSSSQLLPIELSTRSKSFLVFDFFNIRNVASWAANQSSAHHENFESTYIACASPVDVNPRLITYMEDIRMSILKEMSKFEHFNIRETFMYKAMAILASSVKKILRPARRLLN